jgi:hypothetical protein
VGMKEREREGEGRGRKERDRGKSKTLTRGHFLARGPTRTQLCTCVAGVKSPRSHSQKIWQELRTAAEDGSSERNAWVGTVVYTVANSLFRQQ